MDAWASGREAELTSIATSVEGDPITEILRVHADGTIESLRDATQDRYGSGRWERVVCEELMPVAEYNQSGRSMPDDYVFVPMGCEALPAR